ncbi:MAG: hypothetical protein QOI61_607 [Actinomycetota bacterium]
MKRQFKGLAAALLALTLVAACGSDGDKHVETRKKTTTTRRSTTSSSTTADGSTTTVPGATTTTRRATGTTRGTSPGTSGQPVADGVAATKVATLTRPIALAVRPGEPSVVYIAQKGGNVRRLQITASGVTVDSQEVMNIATSLSTGGEQGLLGIAFSANGSTLYASYTDRQGDLRVVGYPFANGRANIGAERLIISVPHPGATNHNGGNIIFGPDGLLYIGTGDGGGAGDTAGNAQNVGVLLGKMLRIQPTASGSPAYTVPGDNPFVGQAGKRPEIWHYGLRNPWRWSFDRANGELWIGDVGQGAWEEIDHVGAGAKGVNFGWNKREGKHAYEGGATPPGAVDPEYEYGHSAGYCSVTGGYVYRGSVIRGFAGTYLFADHCKGELTAASGGSMRQLGIHIDEPASFGEDASGEVWVLSLAGGVYRLGRA